MTTLVRNHSITSFFSKHKIKYFSSKSSLRPFLTFRKLTIHVSIHHPSSSSHLSLSSLSLKPRHFTTSTPPPTTEKNEKTTDPSPTQSIPYTKLSVGVPVESFKDENRVALSPSGAALLVAKGLSVKIAAGAGAKSDFADEAYRSAGASIVTQADALSSTIILKVRAPSTSELVKIKPNSRLFCFVYPPRNQSLVEEMAKKSLSVYAMDCVPRITTAQPYDALSSMSNVSGYKAVLEAANHFGGFFCSQSTSAGRIPPAKMLVIGGGVAGLVAIATARNLGAVVCGFDTRAAAREQIESLGATFITVKVEETGEGAGGYGKTMSDAFIKAEHDLFREQAKQVDIVICTALVPGKPAPKLFLRDMVEMMKPGSVVVDLAAEVNFVFLGNVM